MRKLLFSLVLLSCLSPIAAQEEPKVFSLPKLPSSFAPLSPVGNAHIVGRNSRIVRGATPLGYEKLLKQIGITDVLIFKNDVTGENQREINALLSLGYPRARVTEIPFVWKDLASPDIGCAQVVVAMQKMREVVLDRSRAMFFHCTVGEDRTGVLAASFRMVFDGWSADQAFGNEMCSHGFANANANKAPHVARTVRQNLTPVFAKVAVLIESGVLNFRNLNPALCSSRVGRAMYERMLELSRYECRTGTVGIRQ